VVEQHLFLFLKSCWELAAQMAPYLLLGFAIGGVLHAFLPAEIISRSMGQESVSCVTKATLIGIPLPLCSCGVLPVAASARASGAGKAPTLAFLITTPVTGVDSILATLALLGAAFTGFRIAASFALGMMAGIISIILKDKSAPEVKDSCASCEETQPAVGLGAKARDAFNYAFVELPKNLSGSVLTGLLLGGLISAALPPEFIGKYIGSGLGGILVAVAIGIPLYVCATGSIPIAAAMVMKGFSPGAALAFLIAGPATNMVAFTTVKKILGAKSLVIYLVTIFVGAVGAGLLLDRFMPNAFSMTMAMHAHEMKGLSPFFIMCGIFLLALLCFYKGSDWVGAIRNRKGVAMGAEGKRIVLNVSSMTCEHCKETIIKTLSKNEAVKAVGVDLNKKRVVVSLEKDLNERVLIESLDKVGFEAKLIEKNVP